MRVLKLCMVLGWVLILSACTSIRSNISASSNLNPDINNIPSPVALSIFELSDTAKFQMADFFTLYGNASNALGAALLYEKNIMVAPGTNIVVSVPYVKGARALAYVAAFRNLNNVIWRAVVMLQPTPIVGQELHVRLDRLGVHVVTEQGR